MEEKMDILFQDGMLIDGTGRPAVKGNLAVKNGKIACIGGEKPEAKEIIDAEGLLIAPGFIDIHSHGDFTLPVYRQAESAIGQGITTVVGGNCGMSPSPCTAYYSQFPFEERAVAKILPRPIGGINPGFVQVVPTEMLRPAYRETFGEDLDWKSFSEYAAHINRGCGVNLAAFAGHGQIRLQVLGCDNSRAATERERDEIVGLCRKVMAEGALGISMGLDYEPGMFADDEELEAVAKCVAQQGKILSVHWQQRPCRHGKTNPAYRPVDGIKEMIRLAEKTGVHLHLSHLFLVFAAEQDSGACAGELLIQIGRAREKGAEITYDTLVSYTGGDYFFPQIGQRFQPYVVQAGGLKAFSKALKIGNYRAMIAADIKAGKHPSASVMTSFNPKTMPDFGHNMVITACSDKSVVGKTIGSLCKAWKMAAVDVMLELLARDPHVCWNMWTDTEISPEAGVYLAQPDMAVGLDVSPVNYDSTAPFPEGDYPENCKSTGTYCGFIKYVQKGPGSLEHRIAQMTGIPAQILGWTNRGVLAEGAAADLVVFDKEKLDAKENFLHPQVQPVGIEYVLVEGNFALQKGSLTGGLFGKFLSV